MSHNCIKLRPNNSGVLPVNALNQQFAQMNAIERIECMAAYEAFPMAMTSSFGVHSAVTLHLINQVIPHIPVIMIDTGYLFKETYQYIELLTDKLKLNLKVYQSNISAARFESIHGQLWLKGLKGIEQYNQMRKVVPLESAFNDLSINAWFSGIRRGQSTTRAVLDWVSYKNNRYKVHPILDWTDRDLFMYLKQHDLPQHPLWEKGYLSVGDTHTTKSIHEVNSPEELRFFGLKRECGIHE